MLVNRIVESDGQDAIAEVHSCFDRIAAILAEAAGKVEVAEDGAMLERLTAARVAAQRGGELVSKLAAVFQEQCSSDQCGGSPNSEL